MYPFACLAMRPRARRRVDGSGTTPSQHCERKGRGEGEGRGRQRQPDDVVALDLLQHPLARAPCLPSPFPPLFSKCWLLPPSRAASTSNKRGGKGERRGARSPCFCLWANIKKTAIVSPFRVPAPPSREHSGSPRARRPAHFWAFSTPRFRPICNQRSGAVVSVLGS